MDKNSDEYKKYQRYIASKEFKQIKVDLIILRGCKCENCPKEFDNPTKLQLHHLTYKRLYKEEPEDLKLLCGTCHQIAHGLIKVDNVANEIVKKTVWKTKTVKTRKNKKTSKTKTTTFTKFSSLTGLIEYQKKKKRDKELQERYSKLGLPKQTPVVLHHQ